MRQFVFRLVILASLFLVFGLAGGCKKESEAAPRAPAVAASPQTQAAGGMDVPAGDPDKLAAGDLLDVEMYDLAGPAVRTSVPVRIAGDGAVRILFLTAPIPLAGKTRTQAESAIVAAYQEARLVQHANVSVRRLQGAGAGSLEGEIRPYDLIRVTMLDLNGPNTQEVRVTRVGGDGSIGLPYLAPMKVAGLTESAADDAIVKAFHDANVIDHAAVSVLRLEAAPPDAARLALPDAPIHPVPDALKPLFYPAPADGAVAAQRR